jgi:Protein of unknown function (DUF2827)
MSKPKTPHTKNKAVSPHGLKIGITLFIREGQQSLWENGIFQNCYFLVELLLKSPLFSQVYIVNGGPGDPKTAGNFLEFAPAPVMSLQEAMEGLDIIIELSAQLDAEWGNAFVARGGRIVGMHVANDYIIDAERMAYKLDPGFLMAPVPYAQIWTLPAFAKTCAPYYAAGLRAPVKVMPHLWSPRLLELAAHTAGKVFKYQPRIADTRNSRWRLAIMEPNICTVKTCHLPLILCDVTHRMRPHSIEYLRVYNSLKLKEHKDFVSFARSMELVKLGFATFEGRYPLFDIMGEQADILVSHHWENAQNYLYYEALWGGFPLVHNSDLLGDCGYRYASFDPEDGAMALLQAMASHDEESSYREKHTQAFLETLHPHHEDNIAIFTDTLAQLVEGQAHHG